MRPTRILFVCLGNICRSPTAEVVLRKRAAERGVAVTAESAATHGYNRGRPPDARAVRVAEARGYRFGAKRARTVERADFERFDWLLAMDRQNLDELQRMNPALAGQKARLLMDFAPHAEVREIPDPYGGDRSDFEYMLDLIERAVDGLLDTMPPSGSPSGGHLG
ncbi:MAG: low molecular weight phosphotyrosine protein phosphatase [Alphaproteobacteria bacterium]|jgi:protein-tyrosine phosphatase|nr:low molecular weight phosphotyrosine protein phosphatase [Alphaproteobacteria bacterium]